MEKTLRNEQRRNILRKSIAKVTDNQQISWSEIADKVAQGDITYTLAVTIAQREIEKLDDTNYDTDTQKYLQFFEATKWLAYFLFGVYLCLSFFQKPSWCLEKPIFEPDQNSYYDDCTGTVLEGKVIPVSTIPYLKNWQLVMIEVICVTFLTARNLIQLKIEKRRKGKYCPLLVVTFLVYISDIVEYIVGVHFPFNQFLRPIFLLAYFKIVRKNILLYMRIFWRSKEIFIVITGAFLFYVCLAKLVFYQSAQNTPGSANFDTFPDTLYNLFVSLTTSNYPDTMMPIYEIYPLASLFWITFMAIVGMALLPIILAYFYFNYKEELLYQAKKFQRSKTLKEAFYNYQENESRLSQEDTQVDVSKILKQMESVHMEDINKAFGGSRWKAGLLDALNLLFVKSIFATGSLLTFILAVVQSSIVSPEPQTDHTAVEIAFDKTFNYYWLIVEFALNCFMFLDPLLRFVCLVNSTGWRFIIKSKFLIFEFILSAAILTVLSLNLFDPTLMSLMPIKILLIFRLWRFLKWAYSFEKYRLLFNTIFKLFPLFIDLLGVLGVAFYLYATTAEVLFGGHVKTNLNINFSQYGDPEYYVYVNFNDFFMGMFTCFHLLIVNNWLYTVDIHCRVMGSYLYRIFFVSYYIIIVMICFNVMIAFILDIFVTQISNKKPILKRAPSIVMDLEGPQKVNPPTFVEPTEFNQEELLKSNQEGLTQRLLNK